MRKLAVAGMAACLAMALAVSNPVSTTAGQPKAYVYTVTLKYPDGSPVLLPEYDFMGTEELVWKTNGSTSYFHSTSTPGTYFSRDKRPGTSTLTVGGTFDGYTNHPKQKRTFTLPARNKNLGTIVVNRYAKLSVNVTHAGEPVRHAKITATPVGGGLSLESADKPYVGVHKIDALDDQQEYRVCASDRLLQFAEVCAAEAMTFGLNQKAVLDLSFSVEQPEPVHKVKGVLRSPSGEPLSHVRVQATSPNGYYYYVSTLTNRRGEYYLPRVSPDGDKLPKHLVVRFTNHEYAVRNPKHTRAPIVYADPVQSNSTGAWATSTDEFVVDDATSEANPQLVESVVNSAGSIEVDVIKPNGQHVRPLEVWTWFYPVGDTLKKYPAPCCVPYFTSFDGNLPAGTYKVFVLGGESFRAEWYKDATKKSLARVVTVESGQKTKITMKVSAP